jgi:hypothetical protein
MSPVALNTAPSELDRGVNILELGGAKDGDRVRTMAGEIRRFAAASK